MNDQLAFYQNCLSEFISDKSASILVCGAGVSDALIFDKLKYTNVTFSGMDLREGITGNFKQSQQNAEAISFEDGFFDYCVMHASIHHTRLPHKVITELYRVAKKGVVFIEARDSFLMQLTEKFGLTEEFEVKGNFPGSGVNGTDIPNFIYRWTEREVIKTIRCFDPCYNPVFSFRYGANYPDGEGKSLWKRLFIKGLFPIFKGFTLLFPKQQNLFAVNIKKNNDPKNLRAWLKFDKSKGDIIVDREYIANHYLNK
jgi:ubiquinone/menaquinone biosynthesis C-methylase UbiE